MPIAPTQSNILAALRSFLLAVLPAGTVVVAGQINRVAEPAATSFVVMTPIAIQRLRTNVHTESDVKFSGSISATVMTVTAVAVGELSVGLPVFGVGIAANTVITGLGTGDGGPGTYTVAPSQTVGGETLSAGTEQVEQGAQVTVQLDFHSADLSGAGDMAQTVSTLMRDAFGVDQFASQVPNYGVVPLLADDPRQIPFTNDQQAVEWRWVLTALLQVNQVVSIPQQYADSAAIEVVSVDAAFPP